MSTRSSYSSMIGLGRGQEEATGALRALAVVSGILLTYSYISVLLHITDVVGGTEVLVTAIVSSVVLAVVASRFINLRGALLITAGMLIAGYLIYILSLPDVYVAFMTVGRVIDDTLSLLTGVSVLRITEADMWALGIAPGPTFFTWYLILKRRYVWATVVGGLTLGFFVLTGDADLVIALAGVIGGAGLVGFGTAERVNATWKHVDLVVAILVLMVVIPTLVSAVPGNIAQGGGGETVESTLINANERVTIVGSISLSPQVRFTVTSDESDYWRVAAYNRYTGEDWFRTADRRKYSGQISPPIGPSKRVTQTYVAQSSIETMPAAWKPVEVSGDITGLTQVTDFGGLQPTATLLNNDSYTVESRVPVWSPELLRNTGDDYPDYVEELYLQMPESTPERLEEFTSNLTENATNAYDKAVTIERWLEANKEYSLEVDRPAKNIAYNFVFNMDKGYCVYYATAMVTMLRSQGIPARFVVGYATGQQVDDNEWVIRGLDSHAWVEVYFEDVGWVKFDPTPAQSRLAVEQTTLQDAREQGMESVDTPESSPENNPQTNQPGQGGPQTNTPAGTANETGLPAGLVSGAQGLGGNGTLGNITSGLQSGNNGTGSGGFMGVTPQTVGLSLLTLLGVGAVAHRTGYVEKGYREARLRWQRRTDDPEKDVERAFERLEYVLRKNYRPRRPGETPREYFTWMYEGKMGVDRRIERVFDIHEKARYSPESVTQEEADEAVELVDKIVKDYNKLRD